MIETTKIVPRIQKMNLGPFNGNYIEVMIKSIHDNFWTVYNRCGIGDQNKLGTINISGNSYSSSFLAMLENHKKAAPDSKYLGQESVNIYTLDNIFSNCQKIFL